MELDGGEDTPEAVKDIGEDPGWTGEAVMLNWKLDAEIEYQLVLAMRYVCTMLDLLGLLLTILYLMLSELNTTSRG